MSKKERYISVSEYAKTQTDKNGKPMGTAGVYLRHERGRLIMVKVNGLWLVDTESYKPGKSGRPKKVEA